MIKPRDKTFYIIVAVDSAGGIGKDGTIPWRLPDEMAHFKKITTAASMFKRNAVIMGRKTWESIPEKFRPLADRLNIVLSRNEGYKPGVGAMTACLLDDALDYCYSRTDIEDVFVIGGAELYQEAVVHPKCRAIFLSILDKDYGCDTFFPKLERGWRRVAYQWNPNWIGTVYERNQNGPSSLGAIRGRYP